MYHATLAYGSRVANLPRRTALAKRIGARVRELREAQGLTAEKLAYETDTSKGYLSEIENGGKLPSVLVLDILAERLGVPLAELFREPGTT